MLKRKDLAREFELIVKQEIIDHNKIITASNLSLNEIRAKTLELSQSIDRQVNKLDNKIINLGYEFKAILNDYKTIRQDFIKLVSDNERLNHRNSREIQVIDQSVETVHRNEQKLEKEVNALSDWYYEISKELEGFKKSHEADINRLVTVFSRDIARVKKEILAKPSDIEPVRKEFMEELAMHKIDNEGLLKEIKVLKKSVFINEKKIENLYILIDRMSKK